jgi:hypothetical protein
LAAKSVLSLPIAGSIIHDLESGTGQAIKVETRRSTAAPPAAGDVVYVGLAADARPNLFPAPSTTET